MPSEISFPRVRSRPCTQYRKTIYVRTTDAEQAVIYERAKAAGMSASRYLARVATEGRPPPSQEEREDLRGIRVLLVKMATNLSRLTQETIQANLRGEAGPGSEEISAVLRGIAILSRELKKRLK